MSERVIYKQLGSTIIKERKNQEYSQEELAFVCNIDRTYLARIEEGKANPSVRILNKISRKLRVKICELLEGI